jgi:cytochrome c oxidase subunit 3
MTIIVSFVVLTVLVSYWWLWAHRIGEKPWLVEGIPASHAMTSEPNQASRTGLVVFLAVVTSLFSLFVSAYFMRMQLGDWSPLAEPTLLWMNTGMLVLGSIAIQWASYCSGKGDLKNTRYGLLATGLFTGGFIFGQLWVWQELVDSGFYIRSGPAVAFFYVITGVHLLHMLGGLWVWCRTTLKLWSGAELLEIKPSILLCRTYWHYLLLVWVALFGLLLST